MGTYFNPGNESFQSACGSRIYVDKTGLLKELNQLIGSEDRCVSLSHARRFGKSQAAGMIDAYYSLGSDSRELFSKFEIAKAADYETHLNKYNVIHVDVSSMMDKYEGDVSDRIWNTVYREMKEIFPDILDKAETVGAVLQDVHRKSGKRFVIILDEWDCVIRNCSDHHDLVHNYLQFLHALFKSEESKKYLALAYITGILPIKKIENESALNNFKEYTMVESDNLTKYFGFTKEEVQALCEKYKMDFESVQKWYDGYTISDTHMYNPNSVYEALTRHRLASYWKNTSSFQTINKLITLNMEGLKDDILAMIKGEKVFVNVNTFQNDLSEIKTRDDALTALIHLGYLGYDAKKKKAFIPNFEVSMAYEAALSTGSWKDIAKTISRCDELLSATIDMDENKVAELVELAHDTYTSVLEYNNENSLSCAITMAYFTAPACYNIVREFPSGKGFADIVMIPRADCMDMPPIIIELKWNQTADTAISQIKDRRYAGNLTGYVGDVLLVGISYNKDDKNKKHTCIIEKVNADTADVLG